MMNYAVTMFPIHVGPHLMCMVKLTKATPILFTLPIAFRSLEHVNYVSPIMRTLTLQALTAQYFDSLCNKIVCQNTTITRQLIYELLVAF